MDPIQPIERRSPWVAELGPVRASGDRSKAGKHGRDGKPDREERRPRARREPPPGEDEGTQHGPEADGTAGRHIDVRA